MNSKFKVFLLLIVGTLVISGQSYAQNQTIEIKQAQIQQHPAVKYTQVNALDMVAAPNKYLNKSVTVRGKFDKFSTLGLDYAPAMRNSEEYITFLIQRDDVQDHNIPLSEMKVFLKRSEAEKHIDLNAGDEIEFSGKIFSTALGDVWMDAEKFTVISTQKSKDETKK